MPDLFKRSYLPYLLFIIGALLILIWFRNQKLEGFKNSASESGNDSYFFEMYYADWCPHCTHAKPEFDKLGSIQTINGKRVACKRVEAEKNPEQVRTEVKGFPTIHLYDAKGKLLSEFKGSRTEKGFLDFLNTTLK